MLTNEQAGLLVVSGAQRILNGDSYATLDNYNLTDHLVGIHHAAVEAIVPGATHKVERAQTIGGRALLALRYYGNQVYTTYELQRTLHAQQPERRSTLLEEQFIRGQAAEAFKELLAEMPVPQDGEHTAPSASAQKLRGALQKLGVPV